MSTIIAKALTITIALINSSLAAQLLLEGDGTNFVIGFFLTLAPVIWLLTFLRE